MTRLIQIFDDHGLTFSRMIASSKSTYVEKNKDGKPIFNANMITKEDGKIWWGDLDLVKDELKLQSLANKLKKDLYILREMDARFGSENDPIEVLIKRAVHIVKHE